MNAEKQDPFETTLRTAMAARPEPPDATNLATRAIAMAREERRASTPGVSPLARRLSTLAAAIAMLVVLIVGYAKLATHFVADASAATTTDGSDLTPTLAVGGVGLMLAIVYLATRDLWSADEDDEALRLSRARD